MPIYSKHLVNKSINRDISNKLANWIGAEQGMCHTNVAKAVLYARAEMPDSIQYVEGILMTGGQPHLHAWIETIDDILDPTFVVSPLWTQNGNYGYYEVELISVVEFMERLDQEGFPTRIKIRQLKIGWNDQAVKDLLRQIDPP